MIKSIVVAVDSTQSSDKAQAYARRLAKRYGAALTGIAVLDVPWVTQTMATPIGGGHFKEHRDETVLARHKRTLGEKLENFHNACQAADIGSREIEIEGVPSEQIYHEADRHDLIVLGRETNFHGIKGQDIGDVAERLLRDNPRPIVVIPPGETTIGRGVVIAFDGSLESSRAMQMFQLMGLAADEPVHVVAVAAEEAEANEIAERGAGFFRSHGVEVAVHGLAVDGDVAAAILNTVEDIGAGILVMGAFGPRGFLDRLLGASVTKQLIRASHVPIFVHH